MPEQTYNLNLRINPPDNSTAIYIYMGGIFSVWGGRGGSIIGLVRKTRALREQEKGV